MPDDAKPQTPIDLTLDFESFATKPAAHPPAEPPKPIDLDWDEPTAPPVPPATVAPRPAAVESLPEAVPVPVVVPRVTRPAPVVTPTRPVAAPSRPAESRNGRPAARRNVQAVMVVLSLALATAVATLVLLYALYVGFKAVGTPKSSPTAATRPVVVR